MTGNCGHTRALHVHEVGVGRLHKTLELVAALLVLSGGVEEVDGKRLWRKISIPLEFCTTEHNGKIAHHFKIGEVGLKNLRSATKGVVFLREGRGRPAWMERQNKVWPATLTSCRGFNLSLPGG